MFVSKRNVKIDGVIYKKGEEVPNDVAVNNLHLVEEIQGELLFDTPSSVEVKVEDQTENTSFFDKAIKKLFK